MMLKLRSITLARGAAWAGLLIVWAMAASDLRAHALTPSLLDLRELGDGRVEVLWKTPLKTVPGFELRPILSPGCAAVGLPSLSADKVRSSAGWEVDCGTQGLVGRTVGISGLIDGRTEVMLRIRLEDGRLIRGVLNSRQPMLDVPEREPWSRVVTGYLTLGFEHILGGVDHLLFVLGLLLLVAGRGILVRTITAFTVGHSITLALVVLGISTLPSAVVEAGIAFSILVLAVELARGDHAPPSLLRRFPWAMAFAFGLLHGFGFAGALVEVGLPQTEIPMALFSFNVGIEVGQLAFVAVVLLALAATRPVLVRMPEWRIRIPTYAIGTLAAFWLFQRLAILT